MYRMRTGLMVGLMLLTMIVQAAAADLGKGARKAQSSDFYHGPAYNWTGSYWGATIGDSFSGHIGYNRMMPSLWVFGVEAELGVLGWNDDQSDLFGTLRGRVGYAFGRFMPYATAGIAIVDQDNGNRNSGSNAGLAWGVGAEYAFTPSLRGRVEFLNLDVSDNGSRNASTDILRAGLSMRF
jgi:outer membrane immunogenic protein